MLAKAVGGLFGASQGTLRGVSQALLTAGPGCASVLRTGSYAAVSPQTDGGQEAQVEVERERMELIKQSAEEARQALSRGDTRVAQAEIAKVIYLAPELDGLRRSIRPRSRPYPNKMIATAVAVLQEAGEPMHIQDIIAELRRRGVRLPGQGRSANLIAALTRTPEVRRVSRGLYAARREGS